ncbi:MAG: GDP-mannose 4,6-dehydratase [Terriglobales bacterium]
MKKVEPFRSVLIFGGAGFIGSNWAHHLLEHTNSMVHVFDNLSREGVRYNLAYLKKTSDSSGRLQVTIGDVRDAAAVEAAVRGATEIYNFAAQVAVTTSVLDPRHDFEVNVMGTFNILEAARKTGRRPFLLFTSTNKVYGDMVDRPLKQLARRYEYRDICGVSESQPLDFHSPYGCSKGAADQYVRDYARIYGLPTVVLRMSCIAGPRQFGNEDQGWVAHFLYSALANTPVVVYGDGRQVRDVLCVYDLIRVFELTREKQDITAGEIYNVGGGPENTVSLLELIDEVEDLTGCRVRYERDQRRPGDQLIYVTDTSKLQRETGWRPQYDLRQTLAEMYRWWKRNRALFVSGVLPARVPAPVLQEVPGAAA